jgi:hypothetical protein
MCSASKDGVSPRMCIKLALVVLCLSSGGASVLPGLLSPGSTSVDSSISGGRLDLRLQANGEVVVYRRDYSATRFGAAPNPMRWRIP